MARTVEANGQFERHRPAGSQPGHPGAWTLWAVAAALPALTTRNPAYLLLLLLAVAVAGAALPARAAGAGGWSFLFRVALFLWLFTVPLNALTAHYGQTVLFTLPRDIPILGPVIGGPITLEATAFGFLSGLGLIAVLAIFVTLNRAVDPYRLLRAVPTAFFQTGVMASIALSFVPQALAAWREIGEAQAIRGAARRGLRGVVPMVLPLLTTGLERSLQLAESMEARGFGVPPLRSLAARRWGQGLLLVSLLLLLVGLLLRAGRDLVSGAGWETLTAALLAAGVGALLLALALHGRSVRRTRYRPRNWSAGDTAATLCTLSFAAVYVAVLLLRPAALAYAPYPRLAWPDFQPLLGALFLLPALAAVILARRRP